MCTWMYLCRGASCFWWKFPDLRFRPQLRRMRVSDAAAIDIDRGSAAPTNRIFILKQAYYANPAADSY